MAIARNVRADRGLTIRMFTTGLLLVVLYAGFIAILWAIGLSFAAIVVIGAIIVIGQYWFSDRIAMWSMHARVVSREEAPELHGIVDRLCALADMPKPRVAIAEVDMPNAFATGRSPKASVICATRGLLHRLDEGEVEAVLAHEISHVAHRDVAVMTIASTLGIVAGLTTRMMFYAGLFGGFGGGRGRGNNQGAQQLVLIELAIMAVSVVVYAISFLLTRALSRYRELAADRSGALLIGRPSVLASALVKVTGEMSRIPTRDLRRAEAFNAFFFTPALTQGRGGLSISTLFATHPPLERRLAQLAELEHRLGQPS
ncbi:MAG: zinc metalloprotease HtpX [Acidimicrobiales bacterium]